MNDSGNQLVRSLASRFRHFLMMCEPQELPELFAFSSFPRGNCGDASDLLAKYLIEHGIKDVQYVFGSNGRQTHGWLEVGDLIVDITADQFDGIVEPVIVSRDREFHNRFRNQRRRDGDFEKLNDSAHSRLNKAYETIISKSQT